MRKEGRGGYGEVIFICVHVYDVALLVSIVQNMAFDLILVGHPCPKSLVPNNGWPVSFLTFTS